MKLQRTLAPTAAPISAWNLLCALKGLVFGGTDRARLRQEFKNTFSADNVFLVSSGKAALTLILKAVSASSKRRKVIIPAYTCFSVPSAIERAGLEVVLCDSDPRTLDFNFTELETLLTDEILCVVSTHLFGFPADVTRVRRFCEPKGIVVIEDAAQAMGVVSRGRLLGTVGNLAFFSLGRGKNLTCGSGGIVLVHQPALSKAVEAEYATLPETPRIEALRNWIETFLMKWFIHPVLYWLPAGLPFLRLGETKFYTDFPMSRMDEARAIQLRAWEQRVNRANRERVSRANRIIDRLKSRLKDAQPITAPDAVYLRLPVLVKDRGTKEAVCKESQEAGAGISGNYPATIQDIPELAGRIADRKCPGAQEIVDRLVTIPTHHFVTDQDHQRIADILKGGRQEVMQSAVLAQFP